MNILVCGTRKKLNYYKDLVYEYLDLYGPDIIIEGCCPNSADEYAEEYSKDKLVEITHFPSTSGNYLKRNIEMLDTLLEQDKNKAKLLVIAFSNLLNTIVETN